MDTVQTLIKFVPGGSIIVGVTWLAQQVNPRHGAILAAAPIITTLAFLFTYNEAGVATTQQTGHRGILFCHPYTGVPSHPVFPYGQVCPHFKPWRGVRDLVRVRSHY